MYSPTPVGGIFQSTLPVWGATIFFFSFYSTFNHFNPRSPCGERLFSRGKIKLIINFNPRSPCGERLIFSRGIAPAFLFQSTLPVWGATTVPEIIRRTRTNFNPRSPCGERLKIPVIWTSNNRFQSTLPVWGATLGNNGQSQIINDFNPRSPCGERPA